MSAAVAFLARYGKGAVAVVAAVASALVAAYTDNTLTPTEVVNVAIAGVGALTVVLAANLPAGAWAATKAWMAGLSAGLAVLASVIVGGLTLDEGWQIAVAVLGAAGVWQTPNAPAQDPAAL